MIENCNATATAASGLVRGGGLLLWLFDVRAVISNTLITRNYVTGRGGVLAQGGGLARQEAGFEGLVQLRDGTVFVGNRAENLAGSSITQGTTAGHAFIITGGEAQYNLPAPAGRYVNGVECRVRRQACEIGADMNPTDPACAAAEAECSLLPDVGETCNGTFMGVVATTTGGVQCRPATGIFQACNWQANSAILGTTSQALEDTYQDEDFPYACIRGRLGSADPQYQVSPSCRSACPAGFFCPTEMTVTAQACSPGHYCPESSSVPIPCAGGTYSSRTDLIAQTHPTHGCTECPRGHSCSSGALSPTPCGLGTHQSQLGQSECNACIQGQYSAVLGAETCLTCGVGNYSANVLSCLPCAIGEFCPFGSTTGIKCPTLFTTTIGVGSTEEKDCVCRTGMYMQTITTEKDSADGNKTTETTYQCVSCPSPGEKTNCTYDGATLETLPLIEGYWRSSPTSAELRWCFTREACVGGSNLSEVCRLGHRGAFCDSCLPAHHKGPTGVCEACATTDQWGTSMIVLALLVVCAVLVCGYTSYAASKKAAASKKGRNDPTEEFFAKGDKTGRAVNASPFGPPQGGGGLGLPLIGLPSLIGVLRLKFPHLAWPDLPDVQLPDLKAPGLTIPYVQLPDVTLPELRVMYPHLQWPTGSGIGLPDLFNLLQIAFPNLSWPEMPDISLPEWLWPEMPSIELPSFPSSTRPQMSLPHWGLRMDICGINFEGFSIKLRILISLFQVLCQIGMVYSIPWPPMLSGLLSILNFIQLDLISFVPIGCLFEINFYGVLIFQTLLLPVLALVPLALSCCRGGTARRMNERAKDVLFWVLFIIYPSVSTKVFAVFGCISIDDGTSWLRADLSISCQTGTYGVFYAYSWLMILVYPLGTPLFYYYLMRKHQIALEKLKSNQMLRSKLIENVRAEFRFQLAGESVASQKRLKVDGLARQKSKAWRLDELDFRKLPDATQDKLAELAYEEKRERKALPGSIRKLTKGYEMRVWWFEIFECFRKLSIACVPVFFQPSGSPGQLVFGLMICFVAFGAYVAIDPFDDVANDTLAKVCQAQIFFSLLSSVLLAYDQDTRNDATNLDVLLVILWVTPLFLAVFLQSPVAMVLGKVLNRRDRAQVRAMEKRGKVMETE